MKLVGVITALQCFREQVEGLSDELGEVYVRQPLGLGIAIKSTAVRELVEHAGQDLMQREGLE